MPKETGRTRTAAALKVFLILSIPFLDQASKMWVTRQHFTLVHNTGTAFGLFPNTNLFFILLSMVIIAYLLFLLLVVQRQQNSPFSTWFGLVLILGGAIGNLIDRMRLGYVVDFIDLRVWPVFNLADSCITIGIVWLLGRSVVLSQRR